MSLSKSVSTKSSLTSIECQDNVANKNIELHITSLGYVCQTCRSVFPHECSLREHCRIHSGENGKLLCTYCGALFTNKLELKAHCLLHTRARSYLLFCCDECGRGFRTKQGLKDHYMIHTGEKPHICPICNKDFRIKNNLRLHMRVHTGERPYKCNICYHKFTQKGSLNNHLKKIHSIPNKNISTPLILCSSASCFPSLPLSSKTGVNSNGNSNSNNNNNSSNNNENKVYNNILNTSIIEPNSSKRNMIPEMPGNCAQRLALQPVNNNNNNASINNNNGIISVNCNNPFENIGTNIQNKVLKAKDLLWLDINAGSSLPSFIQPKNTVDSIGNNNIYIQQPFIAYTTNQPLLQRNHIKNIQSNPLFPSSFSSSTININNCNAQCYNFLQPNNTQITQPLVPYAYYNNQLDNKKIIVIYPPN